MEVTQRGSLQIRGLPPGPAFAEALATLGVEVQENPPVLVAPSLAWEHTPNAQVAQELLHEIRELLRDWSTPNLLGPKVSILVDYAGSALNLDLLPADIRFFVRDSEHVHVSIAGAAAQAVCLGWTAARGCVAVLSQLLVRIAELGIAARAARLSAAPQQLAAALGLTPGAAPTPRLPPEYLGTHREPNGRVTRGFALAFGYADSATLEVIAQSAARLGALSIRPAPERTLLVVGLEAASVAELVQEARGLGLIHEPSDPRRYVIACPGAPLCRSGEFSTRQWAPKVAAAARSIAGPHSIIHLSGCTKGCAYPHAASFTFAGPDRLISAGRADSEPAQTLSISAWIHALEQMDPLATATRFC
jgi:precorrin-3B synthase